MYLKLYNGRNLLSVPFNSNNINSFGTKLADILFSKRELYQGMFEPGRGFDMRRVPLDQAKVNLYVTYTEPDHLRPSSSGGRRYWHH